MAFVNPYALKTELPEEEARFTPVQQDIATPGVPVTRSPEERVREEEAQEKPVFVNPYEERVDGPRKPAKDWEDLTPDERKEAGSGLGPNVPEDVPDLEYIERNAITSEEVARRAKEDKTFVDGLKEDALPILGSIIVPLFMATPGGAGVALALGIARLAVGAGAGAAAGEGIKMFHQWLTGSEDAPEDATEIAARLGTQAAYGAAGEGVGQLAVRGAIRIPSLLKNSRNKAEQAADSLVRGTVEKGVARQANEIASDLARGVTDNLSSAQRGEVLQEALRGGKAIANEVAGDLYKQADNVLNSTPTRKFVGTDPDTGRAVYEMVPGQSLDLGGATEPLLSSLTDIVNDPKTPIHVRELINPILERVTQTTEGYVSFADAHRLRSYDLESVKAFAQDALKGPGSYADKAAYRQIIAEIDQAQKGISSTITATARSAGPDAERFVKEADEMLRNPGGINSQFIQELITRDPEGAGAHLLANGSRQEILEVKRSLDLAKKGNPNLDVDSIWADAQSGYFSNVISRSIDEDTGKFSAKKLLDNLNEPDQIRNMRAVLGDRFDSTYGELKRAAQHAVDKPAKTFIAPVRNFNGMIYEVTGIPVAGLASVMGGLVEPMTAVKTIGSYLGIRVTPKMAQAIGTGTAASARFVARSKEVMDNYTNQILSRLMSNPQDAKLLAQAMSTATDAPNAARISAQLTARIAEIGADLEPQLKEALTNVLEEFNPDPSVPFTNPYEERPTFVNPYDRTEHTQPEDSGIKVDRVYAETDRFTTPEAQEWVDKYQRANPGVSRSQAIAEGKRQGKVHRNYRDPPLGIRNNNPGNIRKSDISWKGKVEDGTGPFETFETPEHGIRAMVANLNTYSRVHGANTVNQIISRWAPPNENQTNNYIGVVARRMGVQPNERLNLNDPNVMQKLVEAIIYVENGSQPYDKSVIQKGIRMATKKA